MGGKALPTALGGQSNLLFDEFCDGIDLSDNPWMRCLLGQSVEEGGREQIK